MYVFVCLFVFWEERGGWDGMGWDGLTQEDIVFIGDGNKIEEKRSYCQESVLITHIYSQGYNYPFIYIS